MKLFERLAVGSLAVIAILMCGLVWRFFYLHKHPRLQTPLTKDISPALLVGNINECKGAAESPYTLVEFGDYQCGPCIGLENPLHKVLNAYKGKLKFQFHHFPIRSHRLAMGAALAAEKARAGGNFWVMHDALYRQRGELQPIKIEQLQYNLAHTELNHADDIGSEPAAHIKIEKDIALAKQLHLTFTPGLFLCCPDGRIFWLQSLDQIEQEIPL